MIEVNPYVLAENVMPFKKLALISDDDFKHTFKAFPLHLRICTRPLLLGQKSQTG